MVRKALRDLVPRRRHSAAPESPRTADVPAGVSVEQLRQVVRQELTALLNAHGAVIGTAHRMGQDQLAASPAHQRKAAHPDLLTVPEFAKLIGIAESSVFELINKGLPSFKSKHVGRRIKGSQAVTWLAEGGADRSRIGKRLAKEARARENSEERHG